MQQWCDQKGARLVDVFEDRVSGGKPLSDRPGLARAIDSLAPHHAGVLLVMKRDRLARDVMVAAFLETKVQQQGAQIVSVAGEGEGNDPSAVLMRRIVDAFAEYERGLIRARTKAAMGVLRARGRCLGNAPVGYKPGEEKQLVANDNEAAMVLRAKHLRAEGVSWRKLQARLAEEGYASRKGGPPRLATLCNAIRETS